MNPTEVPDQPSTTCRHADHDAFDILLTCHEHVLERLGVLESVADDLARTGELTDGSLARLCEVLAMLDVAIPLHSADEEQTLFPVLRELPPFRGTQGTPMDCMEEEHVLHKALMTDLKRAIMQRDASGIAAAARSLVLEYRGHIDKENSVLFPLARQLVTDAGTLADMTRAMKQRRQAAGLGGC